MILHIIYKVGIDRIMPLSSPNGITHTTSFVHSEKEYNSYFEEIVNLNLQSFHIFLIPIRIYRVILLLEKITAFEIKTITKLSWSNGLLGEFTLNTIIPYQKILQQKLLYSTEGEFGQLDIDYDQHSKIIRRLI